MMNIVISVLLLLIGEISARSESDVVQAIRQKIAANPRLDLAAEADYIDEIFNGPRVKDTEKQKRQAGCMCVAHFLDPHCGTDLKVYDNGCFFMCAQDKDPGLRLKRWGNCPPPLSPLPGYTEVEI